MSIITLQRRLAEVGRIRIGEKRATSGGRSRPAKLDVFRLTSRDRQRLDAAAEVYGGKVREWGDEFECYTTASALDIALIPGQAVSQYMEHWGKFDEKAKQSPIVCLRRCDGVNELLSDSPCLCAVESGPDGERLCRPTTRLLVVLRRVPGMGAWRLDTHGWNAAQELVGSVGLLEQLTAAGRLVPARLRLEERKRNRRNGTVVKFAVPVVDVDVALDDVLAVPGGGGFGAVPIEGGARALPSAPDDGEPVQTITPARGLAAPPTPSVAEQLAMNENAAPKKRRAERIPPTDVEVMDGDAPMGAPEPNDADDPHEDSGGERRRPNLVAMACRDAGLDDAGRHALCHVISGGRTSSSAELTDDEEVRAKFEAELLKRGLETIDVSGDAPRIVPNGDAIGAARKSIAERLSRLDAAIYRDVWKRARLVKVENLQARHVPRAEQVLADLEATSTGEGQ